LLRNDAGIYRKNVCADQRDEACAEKKRKKHTNR